MWRTRCWPAIFSGAALLLTACAAGGGGSDAGAPWVEMRPENPNPDPPIRIIGTVRRIDVEGGVFVIRDDQGTQYQPLNLPSEFQVEGMNVEAEVRRRDDMASIAMVGPLVELERIRQQSGGTGR